MAKGQQRSNREKKKPKKAKIATASATPYSQQAVKGAPQSIGLGKKP